tara:strand:+ start:1098 stop:1322 length:225 start_codon:yes stop_codon:yes gene_type:complete
VGIIFSKSNSKRNQSDCISFTIGENTGCQFMCDYCAENLGTNNFYFTDWICKNRNGICTGTPSAFEEYTCCSED